MCRACPFAGVGFLPRSSPTSPRPERLLTSRKWPTCAARDSRVAALSTTRRGLEWMGPRTGEGGASWERGVVIGREGPLRGGGLRFADEPARHKVLDAIGDLALLGAPLR